MDTLQLVSILNDIEDMNETQTFIIRDSKYNVVKKSAALNENTPLDYQNECYRFLRLTFPSSSDFYGRITIYNLEVYGYEQSPSTIS